MGKIYLNVYNNGQTVCLYQTRERAENAVGVWRGPGDREACVETTTATLAAAPEMLEALVRMLRSYKSLQAIAQEYGREDTNGTDIIYEVENAIRKAEGKGE